MHWTIRLAREEDISQDLREEWHAWWVPYSELSEEDKVSARAWARKALAAESAANKEKLNEKRLREL